jgi:molybdate transport system substrate-binding protein
VAPKYDAPKYRSGYHLTSPRRWLWISLLALCIALPFQTRAERDRVVVFAAASLKNALDEVAAQWRREASGREVALSYAASSALARQIEQGAPADLFISADLEWMNYLAERDLIEPDTRGNVASNRLVLIAAKDSAVTLDPTPGFSLREALDGGRLAVAAPEVPAGKYARAALAALGVLRSVERRFASAENVRAALTLVARGEAPLGIVYRSDAVAEPVVRLVATFPEDVHPPIIYPAALLRSSKSLEARSLLAFLRSATARASFEKAGFTSLP